MFLHWTNKPIDKLEPRNYIQQHFKPSGFWFSKDKEWLEWCLEESMFIGENSYCYQLDIDMKNFIQIDTFDKLIQFQELYEQKHGINKNYIDWNKIKEKYDGIFFDNYKQIKLECNKLRLLNKLIWFYGIDVSSGCIFNVDCIKGFTKI